MSGQRLLVTGFLGCLFYWCSKTLVEKACELRYLFALGSHQALCLEGAVGEEGLVKGFVA